MASIQEVERAIRSLAQALKDASPDPGSVPDRSILCVVPDLKTSFYAELRKGRLSAIKQVDAPGTSDVKITARSDDLIALIEGRLNVGFAFLTGKVRVDASASDLMLLRRLF